MFWDEEDEVDVEGLRQRFERESQADALGYYSQNELQELFDWYLESNAPQSMRTVIEHASYLYPEWIQVEWWRSLLAYEEERYMEAYVHGMRAFEHLPLTKEVYEHLVEVSLTVGRTEVAQALLEQWWDEASSDNQRAWGAMIIGEVLLLRDAPEAALPYLWRGWTVASGKRELTILRLLAQAYRRSGRYDEGVHAFHRRLWIEPTRVSLWLGLARMYLYKYAYAQANQALNEAETLLNASEMDASLFRAELHKLRAQWYEAFQRWDEAFRQWLWVRHYQPNHPFTLSKLLEYYQRIGDREAAERYVERLYKYGIHLWRVRQQIADFHWEEGRYDQAMLYYRTLLGHPVYRAHALGRLLLGAVKVRDKRTLQRALRYGQKHFAHRPTVWLGWVEMAFRMGYHVFALSLLEYAFKQKDFRPPARAFYWHAALSVLTRRYEAGLLSLELALIADRSQLSFFYELIQGSYLPVPYRRLIQRYCRGQLSPA